MNRISYTDGADKHLDYRLADGGSLLAVVTGSQLSLTITRAGEAPLTVVLAPGTLDEQGRDYDYTALQTLSAAVESAAKVARDARRAVEQTTALAAPERRRVPWVPVRRTRTDAQREAARRAALNYRLKKGGREVVDESGTRLGVAGSLAGAVQVIVRALHKRPPADQFVERDGKFVFVG